MKTISNIDLKHINAMAEELIGKGNTVKIRVIRESMSPLLKTDDIVLVKKIATKNLRLGDIVLLNVKDEQGIFVIHRIAKIIKENGKIVFMTRGDRNIHYDAHPQRNVIIGRVAKRQRGKKLINLENSFWFVSGIIFIWLKKTAVFLYCSIVKLSRKIKNGRDSKKGFKKHK